MGPRLPWTGAAGGWGPCGPFAYIPMLLFLNKARVDGTRLHASLRRPQPATGLHEANFLETRLDQLQGDLRDRDAFPIWHPLVGGGSAAGLGVRRWR